VRHELLRGHDGEVWLEAIARIPTQVEIASEYRYRDSVPNPKTLVVTISQSGETADTLAALKHARSLGMERTLTICNVATSAMVRECKLAYVTRAAWRSASRRPRRSRPSSPRCSFDARARAGAREDGRRRLGRVPQGDAPPAGRAAGRARARAADHRVGRALRPRQHALFLGRGMHYPIALEGALKLKEISYIHAEAYPAGELKHGPLALVDAEMPVVAIAPNDALLEKLKSNLQEVRARGGELYVVADATARSRPRTAST
jgi:glucosamine--fructose-6-phosphate aminotransferase (isomerizing)